MNQDTARLWYEKKHQSLSDTTMDTLWQRHAAFIESCLAVVDANYPQIGNWTTYDSGYPDRMRRMTEAWTTIANAYMAGTLSAILGSVYRAYLFGYYGNAWQLAGQVTGQAVNMGQPMKDTVTKKALEPWQGGDLASRMDEARLDFLRRVRREAVLSQSVMDKDGKVVGEGQAEARQRIKDVCGYPETVTR
jgi:hypothetical protein